MEPGVASGEIERDGLVVPNEVSVAEFEAIDGQREELLDCSRAGDGGRSFGKICGAIGIKREVNDRLIEDEFLKGQFGPE